MTLIIEYKEYKNAAALFSFIFFLAEHTRIKIDYTLMICLEDLLNKASKGVADSEVLFLSSNNQYIRLICFSYNTQKIIKI